MKTNIILIFAVVSLISACGSSSDQGQVALQVEDSRGPSGLENTVSSAATLQMAGLQAPSDKLRVASFRVTITGPGIDPPIVATAEASATQIEIQGIPAGDRTILIEAMNAEGQVIRRKTVGDVEIKGGVVTPLHTRLNTIPVILNLREDNVVLANRLRVFGFGEPGASLKVDASSRGADSSASEGVSYNQSAAGDPITVSPSMSTGLFEVSPPAPLPGKQTITITDEGTGESSSVGVYVVRGSDRPGRRLVSAMDQDRGPVTIGSSTGSAKGSNFPKAIKNLEK